jgi:hypothetical protein
MGKPGRYGQRMDHAWAAGQLREFRELIDVLRRIAIYVESDRPVTEEQAAEYDDLIESYGSYRDVNDRLVSLDSIMRDLMEAAQPGLGNYAEPADGGWSYHDEGYWWKIVRPDVLRAIGIHELGEDARRRMRPSSPDLVADQLHPWVWEAAALSHTYSAPRGPEGDRRRGPDMGGTA